MSVQDLEIMLKFDEGLRLKLYDDIRGIPTIGYGRNLVDKGISPEEANLMLKNDILYFSDRLANYKFYQICSPERRMVLINMAFNMGLANLLKFKKTINYILENQFDLAAKEMLDSDWARLLPPRAQRLSKIMSSNSLNINDYIKGSL